MGVCISGVSVCIIRQCRGAGDKKGDTNGGHAVILALACNGIDFKSCQVGVEIVQENIEEIGPWPYLSVRDDSDATEGKMGDFEM